jgi:hypothetical protein
MRRGKLISLLAAALAAAIGAVAVVWPTGHAAPVQAMAAVQGEKDCDAGSVRVVFAKGGTEDLKNNLLNCESRKIKKLMDGIIRSDGGKGKNWFIFNLNHDHTENLGTVDIYANVIIDDIPYGVWGFSGPGEFTNLGDAGEQNWYGAGAVTRDGNKMTFGQAPPDVSKEVTMGVHIDGTGTWINTNIYSTGGEVHDFTLYDGDVKDMGGIKLTDPQDVFIKFQAKGGTDEIEINRYQVAAGGEEMPSKTCWRVFGHAADLTVHLQECDGGKLIQEWK